MVFFKDFQKSGLLGEIGHFEAFLANFGVTDLTLGHSRVAPKGFFLLYYPYPVPKLLAETFFGLGPDLVHLTVAALGEETDMGQTEETVPKTSGDNIIRAPVDFEYQKNNYSKSVCVKCRRYDHRYIHCNFPPYCSYCNSEGHSNRDHLIMVGQQHMQSQQVKGTNNEASHRNHNQQWQSQRQGVQQGQSRSMEGNPTSFNKQYKA